MTDTNDTDTGEPRFEDDDGGTSKGTLRFRHFLVIVIAAIAIVTVLYVWHRSARVPPVAEKPEGVTAVPEGSRTVTLYFADKESEALLTETRLVAVGKDFVEQVEQVMRAFLEGPRGAGFH